MEASPELLCGPDPRNACQGTVAVGGSSPSLLYQETGLLGVVSPSSVHAQQLS